MHNTLEKQDSNHGDTIYPGLPLLSGCVSDLENIVPFYSEDVAICFHGEDGSRQLRRSETLYRAALQAEPGKSSNEALSTSKNHLLFFCRVSHERKA
jgi:hypothetical protein